MKKKPKQTEWWCRKKGTYLNMSIHHESDGYLTFLVHHPHDKPTSFCLDKRLARTLATRLLECLDDLREEK